MPSVEITTRYEHRYPNGAMKTFMPGTHHDQPQNVLDGAVKRGKGREAESPGPTQEYGTGGQLPAVAVVLGNDGPEVVIPARRRRKAKGGTDGE